MDEIPTTATFTHSFTIPASSLPASGGIKIKIESTYTKSGQRRALLGDVLVTQFFNQAPSASKASESVAATVGVESSLDLSDYFSDADGDALVYARESGIGTVTGSTWTYTPAAAGSFSAVVSATDPSGASATMAIAVTAEEPQLPILDTPTGLAVVSVSESGFTVSWDTVANAGSYSVSVLDGNDSAAGAVSVSGTSATATGLSADTAYSVKVRAIAPSGDTPYLDSDWSDSVTVTTDLADGLERATLLEENFSNVAGGWTSKTYYHSSAGDAGTWTDAEGCTNMALANSAIVIGRAGDNGCAISPEISLVNVTFGTVTIAFDTASYVDKSVSGSLSIVDAESGDILSVVTNFSPVALASNAAAVSDAGERIVAKDVDVPGTFRLRFDSFRGTGNNYNRIYLDSIKVTQVYDPDYAVLAAPTDVAGSDAGKYGFTVSWTGVADASGYEVWLNDAFEASCDATDTSMALAGLSDGTSYKVQVKALGDNLHHGDSPLSEAVFVETEEDIQNVVFTVTGAPSGDVYAGDPVSFAVAAAVENTGAAVPVGFSGISGAAFENGTFSWTPAETDVGPNVATFASGAYSTNVAISVVSAYVTTNLFHETFPNCETEWGNNAGMPADGTGFTRESGWTFTACRRGMGGLVLGSASVNGSAVTRTIEPLGGSGTIRLSFRAAGFKAGSSLAVAVSGTGFDHVVSLSVYPDPKGPIPDQDGCVFGPYSLEASGPFTVSFGPASGDGRMGVDEIVVSQTISAKMRVLAAPTGLALSGEAGENGFTVGWNAVDGATNYAVRVLDAAGAVAASAPFCAAPSFAATDLPDDEAYAVQVRATGDSATHFDSDWSAPLAVRTERSALHPTLFFGAWQNAVGDGNLHAPIANTAAVSAALDDTTPVPVTYLGATPSPAGTPSFANGTLSWTPADADVGQPYSLAFEMTPEEGVSYVTNVLCTASDLPPLVAPAVLVGETGVKAASFSWDPDPQYRATGYSIRVWRGSKDYTTPGVCFEDFFDNAMPAGWSAAGTPVAGRYSDEARVKFEATGDTLVTELHSAPVTRLSFRTKLHGAAGNNPSTWQLWASTGGTNENDWVSICSSSVSTGVTSRDFSVSDNYRRFKWTFTKTGGNVGIGNFAAEHAGAGSFFATDCGSASEARSVGTARAFACETLRADTEYFVEVTVTDGTTTQSAIRRFRTLPAPKATLIVIQ